jgi:hypothetical protein
LSAKKFKKELRPAISAAKEATANDDSLFRRNGLIHLQVELVYSTVKLTEYFGALFAREAPSIHDLASCSVKFDSAADGGGEDGDEDEDENEDDSDDLPLPAGADTAVLQLLKAAAIAKALYDDGDDDKRESPFLRRYTGVKRSLEIQRIHEKLLTLITTLLGDKRKPYEAQLARHRLGETLPIPADVDAGLSSDFGQLRLDAVQWMSELLWYTLRYWIPCYPTTADLAFELSLKVAGAPARRAELAQAAQALENDYSTSGDDERDGLAGEMAHVIRYCEKYQGEMPESVTVTSAFYYAIAAALRYQYDLYRDRCLLDDEPVMEVTQADAAAEREEEGGRPTVPLVFSTNYDNALELVFDKNDIGYHVVYPTISGDRRNSKGPVWRLKTCFPTSENKRSTDTVWSNVPSPPTTPPRAGQLIGPLILKIHGAPCLEEAAHGFRHCLVLSETGFLDALAGSNIPVWIKAQLGEERRSRRSLWFLGYSISDWNVRLRLFEHCKGANTGFRGAVDREADLYRTALLMNENINVEQWIADLGLLPQRLLELFIIHRPRSSQRVEALVHGVRNLLEGRL